MSDIWLHFEQPDMAAAFAASVEYHLGDCLDAIVTDNLVQVIGCDHPEMRHDLLHAAMAVGGTEIANGLRQ